MKTLIFGTMLLLGAGVALAQEVCEEDEFILGDTAIVVPEGCMEESATEPITAPATDQEKAREPGKAPEARMGEKAQEPVAGERTKDVIDTAIAEGHLKTFVKALAAAGLVNTLKGEGPFTIFAPSDEAFAKLPQGVLDNLLKPENRSKLEKILTFHIVPGRLTEADLMKMSNAKSLNGKELNIHVKDGKVFVDNAEVKTPDLKARNGVIHVVDAVLMPKD